jgi:16S rRNA processing protein RimM
VTGDKKNPDHSSPATDHSPLLVVGVVRRPHGLAGELSVEVTSSFPERFAPGLSLIWRRGGAERSVKLLSARPHGKRLLLTLEGVSDVDGAEALSGGDLCVPQESAFRAPEGFHYSHELAGMPCENPRGVLLGHVVSLEETAAGPLLEIDTTMGRRVLVPFVDAIVVSVDRKRRRIVLDPPEGLLDLN